MSLDNYPTPVEARAPKAAVVAIDNDVRPQLLEVGSFVHRALSVIHFCLKENFNNSCEEKYHE